MAGKKSWAFSLRRYIDSFSSPHHQQPYTNRTTHNTYSSTSTTFFIYIPFY